jgi:hypothetical protein
MVCFLLASSQAASISEVAGMLVVFLCWNKKIADVVSRQAHAAYNASSD